MQGINPTNFDMIPAYPDDKPARKLHAVHAIIETPGHSRHKYEFEAKFGTFYLKQTLAEGLAWPCDYGFVPRTLADDGDPTDILFITDEPTFTGCLVKARVLGIINITKDGIYNPRVLTCAMPVAGVTQSTDGYKNVSDMAKPMLDGLKRFLVEYSEEEGHKIEFVSIGSRKDALRCIAECAKRFKKKRKK